MRKKRKDRAAINFTSLILFLGSVLFVFTAPANYVSVYSLFIVPFLFGMSLLTRFLLSKLESKDNTRQKLYHVVLSLLKMFLYLIILIIAGMAGIENIASFYISFLVFYLIYLFFDVRYQVNSLSK